MTIAGEIAAVFSIVTAVISAINIWLNLRIRIAMMESEERIMDRVRAEFVSRERCALLHPDASSD
jgi:hypothetical protein